MVPLSSAEYRLLGAADPSEPGAHLGPAARPDPGRDAGPFDRSIDVLIGRLRKRLGDEAKQPELIKTVRGRGYLLRKVSLAR